MHELAAGAPEEFDEVILQTSEALTFIERLFAAMFDAKVGVDTPSLPRRTVLSSSLNAVRTGVFPPSTRSSRRESRPSPFLRKRFPFARSATPTRATRCTRPSTKASNKA